MPLAELETLLPTDEIADIAQLHCLSCRRRLASIGIAERLNEEGATARSLVVSQLSADLRDYHQTQSSLSLACGCSTRSVFHLI